MGSLHSHHVEVKTSAPMPEGLDFGLRSSPAPLAYKGLNFPVVVSHSTIYAKNQNLSAPPVSVTAHFDTGASITAIDLGVAKYLGLAPVGNTQIITAGGLKDSFVFTVDLQFPNSTLSPIVNLPVNSFDLGFKVGDAGHNSSGFALLLGRDVMSRWNIVWNGPTSTVIIND